MHTLETTVESHDRGLDLLPEVLSWLRNSTGYRGMVRMSTEDRTRTIVITLWADEASMLETWEAGREFGELIAETAGTTRVALEDLEVTFIDVAPSGK